VNGQQRMELGPKLGVMGDHARSFAWLMLIIGTFLGTLTVVQNILVHFVFGNPTKVQQQALTLAILLTFDFQVATLGLFLIAGASQFVIAATASLLARSYGRRTWRLSRARTTWRMSTG
jgi:O-antigen/teichoic acid export membrane protein